MKYIFNENILLFIIQHNCIKVFHNVVDVDSEIILPKLVPFFAQIFNEYINFDDRDIQSTLVDR